MPRGATSFPIKVNARNVATTGILPAAWEEGFEGLKNDVPCRVKRTNVSLQAYYAYRRPD